MAVLPLEDTYSNARLTRFLASGLQQSACDVPAMLVIQWLRGAVPADGGDMNVGEFVRAGPLCVKIK